MRLLSLLCLLPSLALADDAAAKRIAVQIPPPDDVRTFSTKDMADLAARIGKDLRKCKQLKKGGQVEISFTNATSEFIDKDAFAQAIRAQIPPGGASGPGKKYDLAVKLSSLSAQKGDQYQGTYTLSADVKQADEVLCVKSEKLVKKGKVGK